MEDYIVEKFEYDYKLDDFYKKYVDFDYTKYKCSQCSSYGNKWSCPLFDFDVDEIWSGYENIKLYFMKTIFSDEFKQKEFSFEDFRKNSIYLFQVEKEK